jgi:hypothetical protein
MHWVRHQVLRGSDDYFNTGILLGVFRFLAHTFCREGVKKGMIRDCSPPISFGTKAVWYGKQPTACLTLNPMAWHILGLLI